MTIAELIHDWNRIPSIPGERRPLLDDETLRDGLQSPSVRDPDIGAKRDLLHRLAALGIDAVDLGMPGAGSQSVASVKALMVEIRDHRLPIEPMDKSYYGNDFNPNLATTAVSTVLKKNRRNPISPKRPLFSRLDSRRLHPFGAWKKTAFCLVKRPLTLKQSMSISRKERNSRKSRLE